MKAMRGKACVRSPRAGKGSLDISILPDDGFPARLAHFSVRP